MSKSSFMIIPLNYWLQEQQKLFWRSVSILLWLLLAWNKHILRRQDAAYQFIALELASWILNVTRQEDIGCISKYNRLTFHTLNRAKLLRSEILLYTNPLLVIFFHILPVKLNGGMAPTSWILQIVVLVPRDQRSNVSCTSLYHSVLCKVCIPSQLQNQNYMDATQACKQGISATGDLIHRLVLRNQALCGLPNRFWDSRYSFLPKLITRISD